jgi:hypothetical protein
MPAEVYSSNRGYMDQSEATQDVVEIAEPAAMPAKTPTNPRKGASSDRVADTRAAVLSAKKKKKRAAHRVALRRSHTKG